MMLLTRNKAANKAEEKKPDEGKTTTVTGTTTTTTTPSQTETATATATTTHRFFGRRRRADVDVGVVPLTLVLDLGDDEPSSSNQLGKKDEEDRYMILMESGLFGSKHIQSLLEPIPKGKNATPKQQQKETNNNSMTTDEDSFLWSSVSTAAVS